MLLTNLTFLGKKETLVTAAIIITKPFKFNNVHELMEEKSVQFVEHKYACVSQGERKIGRKKYTLLRKTYNVTSSFGIFTK